MADTPISSKDHDQVTEIIRNFGCRIEPSDLFNHKQEGIADCFLGVSLEEIITRLEEYNDKWSQVIMKTLLSRSSTSLKVTFEQLKRAKEMNFDAIMNMEFNIALRFFRSFDFFKGIRPFIVDKDQSPNGSQ